MANEERLASLLQQIFNIATDVYTVSGKFAHIADLSADCLVELNRADPRLVRAPEPWQNEPTQIVPASDIPDQAKPSTYITIRDLNPETNEPGNFSYKEIPAGTILYRFTGHAYGTYSLPGGVMVSETGPLDTPFFEVPIDALQVYEYQPGKTEVILRVDPNPTTPYNTTEG